MAPYIYDDNQYIGVHPFLDTKLPLISVKASMPNWKEEENDVRAHYQSHFTVIPRLVRIWHFVFSRFFSTKYFYAIFLVKMK